MGNRIFSSLLFKWILLIFILILIIVCCSKKTFEGFGNEADAKEDRATTLKEIQSDSQTLHFDDKPWSELRCYDEGEGEGAKWKCPGDEQSIPCNYVCDYYPGGLGGTDFMPDCNNKMEIGRAHV